MIVAGREKTNKNDTAEMRMERKFASNFQLKL